MNEIEKNLPSTKAAAAVFEVLVKAARQRRRYPRIGDLDPWRAAGTMQQSLVVTLDAAILAGEDGRMLTTNLVFDALAARWSDHYRTALERQAIARKAALARWKRPHAA